MRRAHDTAAGAGQTGGKRAAGADRTTRAVLCRYDATTAALRTSVADREQRLADVRAAAAEAEANVKVSVDDMA